MAQHANIEAPLRGAAEEQHSLWQVTRRIATQAGPSTLSAFFSFLPEILNTVFIGQYGSKEELAAVGLGNMIQNCFGLSVGVGLAGALDTLASQAHGAGRIHLACIYLQRARLVITVQLLWIWPLLACSDVWLTAMGQDPTVSRLAQEYNRASAPFLVFFFNSLCFRRFMTASLRPKGPMIVSFVGPVLHIGWLIFFVGHLNMGLTGLGFANGLGWLMRFLMMACLLWWNATDMGMSRWWVLAFQRDALRGWCGFLKVGLPSWLACTSEWWFWEFCTLVVGYLGATALAAHVASVQLITLVYMIPLGFSASACMLVGNALGAGKPRLARYIANVSVAINLLAVLIIVACMFALRSDIARSLSRNGDVQRIIVILLAIYCLVLFPDSTQSVLSGVLRGIGLLKVSSFTYLAAYYLVMLPAGILLAFPLHLGVAGVWLSMLIGTTFAVAVFMWVLHRTDYEALAAEAVARMARKEAERKGPTSEDPPDNVLASSAGAHA